MSSVQELLDASTNFYRLATVGEIHYATFSHSNSNDQALLDAELDLRRRLPKVLATIYGKELWVFSIDDHDIPSCDASFDLRQSSVQSFSPSSIYRSTNGVPSSLMPVLIVTFLKSLKRLLINNLSFRKELIPFGNSGILSDYSLLQIEPKVLERGDIVISMATIDHGLHGLSEISTSENDLNGKSAIFLAPSGIRVYLAESTIEKSTTIKPSNHSFIVDTLFDLHNIKINSDICTWIKVIPNLPHLNAMTSQISDYLKPVTNIKYLAWPLELCVCKEASLTTDDHFSWVTPGIDPLSLINDFVALKATANAKTPSTAPTANNTPMMIEHHTDHVADARPFTQEILSTGSIPLQSIEEPLDSMNEEWRDLDEELFGDGGEITETDFNFFNHKGMMADNNALGTDIIMNDETILPDSKIDVDVQLDDDLFEDDQQDDNNLASELELLTGRDDFLPEEQLIEQQSVSITKKSDPYDIPLLQLSNSPSPLYQDPGAPLPIQSPRTANKKRSIFSPLNFNPIIKSNVDNKYSSGGKFFVPNVETPNDSSVPVISLSDSIGQDEGDDDDSEEELDEDEDEHVVEDDITTHSSTEEDNDINMIVEETPPFSALHRESGRGYLKHGNDRSQTPEVQIPPNTQSASPSPETTNGVPNSLPFLLRSIPIHSIPSHFYKSNPIVSIKEIDSFLKDLLDQVIWNDRFYQDLPETDGLQDISSHDDIIRAIAQIFPDIQKEVFSDFTRLAVTGSDNIESPSSFKELELIHSSTNDTTPKHRSARSLVFPIPEPKLRVKRLSQEISINSNALNFWNTLGFGSLSPPKDFRVLLFSPATLSEQSAFFLSTLADIYEKSQLGSIEHFSIPETNVQNGLIFVEMKDFDDALIKSASKINEVLNKEQEPLKELLIIIPASSYNLKSTVEIIKLFQKFKNSITQNGQSTLAVKISLKMIPSTYISNRGVLSVVSTNLLAKLSLSIYNLLGDIHQTYTSLISPIPEKINFQLTTQPIASEILSQDSFIHLAYERSIDKEWLVAAWSDQYAKIRESKAWNCSNKMKNNLENVMNDIWSKSLEISNKLSGRKYLVLVRSDGAIPDDELLQWKRLSSKSRELTLVVISVDQNPTLKVQLNDPGFPLKKIFNQEQMFQDSTTKFKMDSVPPTVSSTGLTPLSIFTPQPVNSPDLFSNSRSGGVESPSDSRLPSDDQGIVVDVNDIVHAILLDGPNSLSNAPVRLGVKTGYLIKAKAHSNNMLKLFELNLMSCPGTLSMEEVMKTVLIQFRNLATIAELFGVSSHDDTIIPWHILAVRKSISCLTHIRLQDEVSATK